ncbi:MAG: response regulator [Bacteroidales bacterium]|nr:response regulator [Bacteroidales bacterium]
MKKLLLLEDNRTDAELLSIELKKRWPKIVILVVGLIEEARKLIHTEPDIDFALFDLKLPDGNGMDLLSDLRKENCEIPIIIFTSSGSEEIAIAALMTGANDFIPKKPGFHKLITEQIEFTLLQHVNNLKHIRVLYVEHHLSDVDLTKRYFKNYAPHFHFTIVNSGEEILEVLPDNPNSECSFDIVLLDYQLPGLNALEVCKIIRHERKLSLALVIVTGQGNEKTAVDALKIGVDDYIVKQNNYLFRMPSVLSNAFHRKELEQQKKFLKESETKYRLLADYAADFEFWVNPEGEYVYISSVCERTTGYPREAFIKNKNLLTEITHPDYRESIKKHFIQDHNHVSQPIEFIILTADGKEKWISHFCVQVFDDENNYLGRRGVNRDITERKRAEQLQKLLYNISNAAITSDKLDDLIGIIHIELSAIMDTTNFYIALYEPETDTISCPYFTDEKDKFASFPAGKTLTNYVIKTENSLIVNAEEVKELERQGKIERFGTDSKIWLGVPLKIEGGVMGVLAVQSYTDENAYNKSDMELLEFISDQISVSIDRKRAEVNLQAALIKATESDRLKSAFLANMSHEIRTPMNGIIGFANLLKTPNLSHEKQIHHIDIIEKSSQRLLEIIDDLMNISKIESGQTELFISSVNINAQFDQLFSLFDLESKNKGLELKYKKSLSDNDAVIETDEIRFYGILSNLIKNAIKYTNEGYVEFGYTHCHSIDSPTKECEELLFFVKDTGIGIPLSRQKAIFDRFVQADIEDKEARQGVGLGLSIAKAYVEMLGGKIWVKSKPGEGSQFYFSIPIKYNSANQKK